MHKLWMQEWIAIRRLRHVRLPAVDAMDRATWVLAVAGLLGVFVGWG